MGRNGIIPTHVDHLTTSTYLPRYVACSDLLGMAG